MSDDVRAKRTPRPVLGTSHGVNETPPTNDGGMRDVEAMNIEDEVAILARAAGLPQSRVREFAEFARERNASLLDTLIERGGVIESEFLRNVAGILSLEFIPEPLEDISQEVLATISPALSARYHVIPTGYSDGKTQVACADPFDWLLWDELVQTVSQPLVKALCPRRVIDRMLKSHHGVGADTVQRLLAGREDASANLQSVSTDLSEEQAANEPTVVNLVNQILSDAIRANATDIHLEPYPDRYRVRYRIDGMLEDVSVPVSVKLLRLAMISRIKIMSNLDITEKRLPQDGRAQVSLNKQDYDLRISILPGIHGESVVIRLQTRAMSKLDLEVLGFEPQEHQAVSDVIDLPYGLMLVTGPTGSGKTTTLYACLAKIVKPHVKIITVEDPVEYWMDSILQMQVHEEIGFDFAKALRHILRHDPDVVLIGEIRDRETADIAIRSSLTGHLVFATLHTNDAASASSRLLDIGVEPYLLAGSLQGVLAQRLMRKICPQCKAPLDPSKLTRNELAMLKEAELTHVPLYQGEGCERCRFTGYHGRTAIGEVLRVSEKVREMIQQRCSADQIKHQAISEGMRLLRDTALLKVESGQTTVSEVLRVTQEDF